MSITVTVLLPTCMVWRSPPRYESPRCSTVAAPADPGKSAQGEIDASQTPGRAGAQHRGCPASGAASPHETFLNALRGAGLKFRQPDQVVTAGRTLCDLADSEKADDEIMATLMKCNEMKHNDNLSNARQYVHGYRLPGVLPPVHAPGRRTVGSLSPKIETAATAVEFLVERHTLSR
ncbi:DUF732 domain-containing protein [[Mycobacterium] crassicus]|uniref:DUF732 domain-containing protein n=1 Tax=[Mycobacterium] crassicus TaxID=2872309 RepID=A0ABU5XCD4_9MYCO|nr:DUF732 domain-containing protein [Mycolicibacter sp. MYC098]MEB3019945.1 DUF732 domain-containing protein [Mycolicibacter sp. MYC098]